MITPTEPLRSAYIVADITMQDPVAISLQGELYALERRVLAEYNGDNTPICTGNYLDTHTMIELSGINKVLTNSTGIYLDTNKVGRGNIYRVSVKHVRVSF